MQDSYHKNVQSTRMHLFIKSLCLDCFEVGYTSYKILQKIQVCVDII